MLLEWIVSHYITSYWFLRLFMVFVFVVVSHFYMLTDLTGVNISFLGRIGYLYRVAVDVRYPTHVS